MDKSDKPIIGCSSKIYTNMISIKTELLGLGSIVSQKIVLPKHKHSPITKIRYTTIKQIIEQII